MGASDVFYLKPLNAALTRAGLVDRGQGAVYGSGYELTRDLFHVTLAEFPKAEFKRPWYES